MFRLFLISGGLSAWLFAQSPVTATVAIDTTKVIKTFDRKLVGSNIEWFQEGDGIFSTQTGGLIDLDVTAAKDMGVGLIRFPGGTLADYYLWQDGIGPRSKRPIRPNVLSGGVSANDFGTPELLTFAQRTGADILMQTDVISDTAASAAAWVNYCNIATNAERIADGFPTPYPVRYWEIGNEQYMSSQGSSTPASFISASEYSQRFLQWSAAMKAVDPTIKVGAVTGKNFGPYAFVADPNWNKTVLQNAAKQIDFLALHNAYGPIVYEGSSVNIYDVYHAFWAFPCLVAQNLADIENDISTYAPTEAARIQLAITEWGPLFHVDPSSPWIDHTKTMGSAIFVANLLQVLVRTPQVALATQFKLVENSFMGAIQVNGIYKPFYYALQMFANNFGSNVVPTTVTSPTYASPQIGLVAAVPQVPLLDVVSSLSSDGTSLYIIAVNKSTTSPIHASFTIKGFVPQPTVVERLLTAPALDANNGPSLPVIPGITWAPQITLPTGSMFLAGSPGTVVTQTSKKTFVSNQYDFAALSVTALEFTRAK
jgi:alpha-N-arabinofuranosidase